MSRVRVSGCSISLDGYGLGEGEHLLGGLDPPALGYTCTRHAAGEHAVHFTIEKRTDVP